MKQILSKDLAKKIPALVFEIFEKDEILGRL